MGVCRGRKGTQGKIISRDCVTPHNASFGYMRKKMQEAIGFKVLKPNIGLAFIFLQRNFEHYHNSQTLNPKP